MDDCIKVVELAHGCLHAVLSIRFDGPWNAPYLTDYYFEVWLQEPAVAHKTLGQSASVSLSLLGAS
jgi:hypothetical protein